MKKVIYLLLFYIFCVFVLVPSAISEAQQQIRISYFNVPPFIIYDTNQNQLKGGALYEFLEQQIAPEIDVKFIWDKDPSSIPRQMESISNGSTDAIALLSYTPQRAQTMAFTATPFFISSPGIAILKNNKLNVVEKVDDILGLRIGYGKNLYKTPFMRDKRINFDLVATENYSEQNFKKLMAGRIDAVYAPDLASLLAVIENLGIGNSVKVIKLPDTPSANHVVFARDMAYMALRYDRAFNRINGAETFLKILGKYVDIAKLK